MMKLLTGLATTFACLALLTQPAIAAEKTADEAKAAGAQATQESTDAATAAANAKKKKKSTEVSFEDVLVQGKYHFSDEAVTTVEGDKILDALLGVRTDFKDRLKRSAARH